MTAEDDQFHAEIHGGPDGLWAEFGFEYPGPPDDDQDPAVWLTVGSPYYHRLGCQSLQQNPLLASRVKAENAGFQACPSCRP